MDIIVQCGRNSDKCSNLELITQNAMYKAGIMWVIVGYGVG